MSEKLYNLCRQKQAIEKSMDEIKMYAPEIPFSSGVQLLILGVMLCVVMFKINEAEA